MLYKVEDITTMMDRKIKEHEQRLRLPGLVFSFVLFLLIIALFVQDMMLLSFIANYR